MPNEEVFVTTSDNPYNFFTQFDEWYAFDMQKGYNTCGLVARLAIDSEYLTDEELHQNLESVVDEICKYNVTGLYKKVVNKKNN